METSILVTAVEEAVADDDRWAALGRLAEEAPAGLPMAVRIVYLRAPEHRGGLVWLLQGLRDPAADGLLLEFLSEAAGGEAADLLRALVSRRVVVPVGELRRQLADREALEPALVAAGFACDRSLAPDLVTHLDDPRLRVQAAISLGRLRASECLPALLDRLPHLTGREHAGFVVGVELMGDAAAVPALRELIQTAPDSGVWDLHHSLVRLTGRDPYVPLDAAPEVRRALWRPGEPETGGPPRVEGVRVTDGAVRFVVRDGAGLVRIDYDDTPPGSAWPRWGRSLRVGGVPVYDVGSGCETCETFLRHLGWPEGPAVELSRSLREHLADLAALDGELIEAMAPVLGGLSSGSYLAALTDLDLEYVTEPRRSWWHRREELRDVPGSNEPQWPGTGHFQLRDLIPGTVPSFGAVLPTQPPAAADTQTVADFTTAIANGHRPAAVVLCWAEEKWVEAADQERFLVGVVLDGHHKLLAYAGAEVAARTLLICRLEDSWGPVADRSLPFLDLISPLRRPSTTGE